MRRELPRIVGPALLIAAIAVAVTVIVIVGSGSGQYVVRAEFADADGLTTDFSVREDGVVVGNVAGVSVTKRDTAMVTMDLDRAAAPIGAGASASIHPSNLLGEKYVQLAPGDRVAPLASNALIPMARTTVSPELDQVLDTFNANTRDATAAFLAEEGDALLGRGSDLAATLQELPGSLDATRQFVAGLAHDNGALGTLIDQSDAILADATPRRLALGHLVNRADGLFTTLAGSQAALRGTIAQAPSTIGQLRTSLYALQNAAAPLGPAAAGLRATAPSLTRTLRQLPGLADAADPTLRTLSATAPTFVKLGQEGTPLVSALAPAATKLADFSAALQPFSTLLQGQFAPILNVIDGWARAISDRDGVGHIYRIEVLLPTSAITGALGAAGDTPKPTTASASGGTQSGLGAVTSGVRSVLGHVLSHRSSGRPATSTPKPPTGAATSATTAPPVAPSSGSGSGSPLGSLINYLLGR
ncbi:MAG TPA: MlaD family protein [Solirubrobacteraceae bacterium]|nr:MlaD family protein [Solirubrobacteraceae bacterium]